MAELRPLVSFTLPLLALVATSCSSIGGAGDGDGASGSTRVMATAPTGWSIVSRAAFTPEDRGGTKYFPVASLRGLDRASGTTRLALAASTTIGTTTTNDHYVAKGADGTSATMTKTAAFAAGQVFFTGASDDVQSSPLASSDPATGSPVVAWTSPESYLVQSRKLIDGALYHTCLAKGQPAPVQAACTGQERITSLGTIAYGPRTFETWLRPNGELLFVASREPGKGFSLTRLTLDAAGQWTGKSPELPPVAFANDGLGAITLTHVEDKAFLVASIGSTGSQVLVAFELQPDTGTLTERARQPIDAVAHQMRGMVDPVTGQIAWLDRIAKGSAGEVALPLRDGMTAHTQLDVSRVIVFDPRTAAFKVLPDVARERACFGDCRLAYFAGASVDPSYLAGNNPGSIVWSGGTLYFWTAETALTPDAQLVTREVVVLTPSP